MPMRSPLLAGFLNLAGEARNIGDGEGGEEGGGEDMKNTTENFINELCRNSTPSDSKTRRWGYDHVLKNGSYNLELFKKVLCVPSGTVNFMDNMRDIEDHVLRPEFFEQRVNFSKVNIPANSTTLIYLDKFKEVFGEVYLPSQKTTHEVYRHWITTLNTTDHYITRLVSFETQEPFTNVPTNAFQYLELYFNENRDRKKLADFNSIEGKYQELVDLCMKKTKNKADEVLQLLRDKEEIYAVFDDDHFVGLKNGNQVKVKELIENLRDEYPEIKRKQSASTARNALEQESNVTFLIKDLDASPYAEIFNPPKDGPESEKITIRNTVDGTEREVRFHDDTNKLIPFVELFDEDLKTGQANRMVVICDESKWKPPDRNQVNEMEREAQHGDCTRARFLLHVLFRLEDFTNASNIETYVSLAQLKREARDAAINDREKHPYWMFAWSFARAPPNDDGLFDFKTIAWDLNDHDFLINKVLDRKGLEEIKKLAGAEPPPDAQLSEWFNKLDDQMRNSCVLAYSTTVALEYNIRTTFNNTEKPTSQLVNSIAISADPQDEELHDALLEVFNVFDRQVDVYGFVLHFTIDTLKVYQKCISRVFPQKNQKRGDRPTLSAIKINDRFLSMDLLFICGMYGPGPRNDVRALMAFLPEPRRQPRSMFIRDHQPQYFRNALANDVVFAGVDVETLDTRFILSILFFLRKRENGFFTADQVSALKSTIAQCDPKVILDYIPEDIGGTATENGWLDAFQKKTVESIRAIVNGSMVNIWDMTGPRIPLKDFYRKNPNNIFANYNKTAKMPGFKEILNDISAFKQIYERYSKLMSRLKQPEDEFMKKLKESYAILQRFIVNMLITPIKKIEEYEKSLQEYDHGSYDSDYYNDETFKKMAYTKISEWWGAEGRTPTQRDSLRHLMGKDPGSILMPFLKKLEDLNVKSENEELSANIHRPQVCFESFRFQKALSESEAF